MNEPAMTIPEQAVGELIFWYRNYRGEEGYRRVRPISLRFGRSDYHKEPQWLLRALDLEKNEQREFALADAKSVVGGPVLDFTADLLPLVGVQPTDSAVLQDDLRDMLRALGMPDGARPQSPHEVFRECIEAVKALKARDPHSSEQREVK